MTRVKLLQRCTTGLVTDRISVGDKAITSVRLSVRPFVLALRNRLTVNLYLLRVNRS